MSAFEAYKLIISGDTDRANELTQKVTSDVMDIHLAYQQRQFNKTGGGVSINDQLLFALAMAHVSHEVIIRVTEETIKNSPELKEQSEDLMEMTKSICQAIIQDGPQGPRKLFTMEHNMEVISSMFESMGQEKH